MRNLILLIYLISVLPWQPARAMTDVDKQDVPFKNWIKNSGFENGFSNWTVTTDTLTLTVGTTQQQRGKAYLTWNSAGASRVLTHETVTVDAGMIGQNATCGFQVTTATGTATHLVRAYDGTNVLASATITSSTIPTWSYVSFIVPASGTVQCQLVSVNADEPSIDVLDSFMGRNIAVQDVSQAQFVGKSYIVGTSACSWSRTNTALGAFTDDPDCPGPTIEKQYIGTWVTTDTDKPQQTINSLPPGVYKVTASGCGYANGASVNMNLTLNDGTTSSGLGVGSNHDSICSQFTIIGWFEYTTAGNRTWTIWGSSTSNNAILENNASPAGNKLQFIVERYPLTSEQGFRPDIGPSSWSGFMDNTCSFARTNTSYGDPATDASCALADRVNRNFGTVTGSNNLPSITHTPTRIGVFEVCAYVSWAGSNLAATLGFKLWDGTTTIAERDEQVYVTTDGGTVSLCGLYNATSTAAKTYSIQTKASAGSVTIAALTAASAIEWTVKALDFSMNAPVLVGSVTNTGTGAVTHRCARLNCDASSSIVAQLNGDTAWPTSIGNVSGGACLVTYPTYSAAPFCHVTVETAASSDPLNIGFTAAPGVSTVSVDAADNAGSDSSAFDFEMCCDGPR